jgi:hypothetical protein
MYDSLNGELLQIQHDLAELRHDEALIAFDDILQVCQHKHKINMNDLKTKLDAVTAINAEIKDYKDEADKQTAELNTLITTEKGMSANENNKLIHIFKSSTDRMAINIKSKLEAIKTRTDSIKTLYNAIFQYKQTGMSLILTLIQMFNNKLQNKDIAQQLKVIKEIATQYNREAKFYEYDNNISMVVETFTALADKKLLDMMSNSTIALILAGLVDEKYPIGYYDLLLSSLMIKYVLNNIIRSIDKATANLATTQSGHIKQMLDESLPVINKCKEQYVIATAYRRLIDAKLNSEEKTNIDLMLTDVNTILESTIMNYNKLVELLTQNIIQRGGGDDDRIVRALRHHGPLSGLRLAKSQCLVDLPQFGVAVRQLLDGRIMDLGECDKIQGWVMRREVVQCQTQRGQLFGGAQAQRARCHRGGAAVKVATAERQGARSRFVQTDAAA